MDIKLFQNGTRSHAKMCFWIMTLKINIVCNFVPNSESCWNANIDGLRTVRISLTARLFVHRDEMSNNKYAI